MAKEMDRQQVMMFAAMALQGILAGRQLSGKMCDPKVIAKDAVDFGLATERELRSRIYLD